MRPQYKFFLVVNDVRREVFPTWDDAVSIDFEQEQDAQYYREKLSGKFTFTRLDYDYIAAQSIETEFGFIIQERISGTWTDTSPTFYFTKTDLTVDEDARQCSVQPITNDRYRNILKGLDREFDLIQLAPVSTPVAYKIRGILQVYILNQTYLTNYVGGSWWEQSISDPAITRDNLTADFKFSLCKTLIYIPSKVGLTPDVSGFYDPTSLRRLDSAYRLQANFIPPSAFGTWEIVDSITGLVVYETEITNIAAIGSFAGLTFTSLPDPSSTCIPSYEEIYARILTNELTVDGNATELIPENDIIPANPNYKRVIGVGAYANFTVYQGTRSTPGEFGRFAEGSPDEGLYFERLTNPVVGETSAYPVNPSGWRDHSIWMWYDNDLRSTLEDAATPNVLTVAYHIADVLMAILQQIAPGVTHSRSNVFSFLYAATNTIRGDEKYPLITPKSNFITARYDQPASRAKIKLSEIFDLLRIFYKAYWIIDEFDRLLIEHISWHDNGGAYDTQLIDADLTALTEPKSQKNWGYRSNKYSYDKSKLPERLTFKWMDSEVSSAFKGSPIVVRSIYAEAGNQKEETIGKFTSDVDYIIGNPSAISPDGFVFMDAVGEGVGGDLELPIYQFTLSNGVRYEMQNGYASLTVAHDAYHRHGLPASLVTLNGDDLTAITTERRKIQEITYPAGITFNPVKLTTTGQGSGKKEKVSINLSTRESNITIRHDTE